MIKEINICWKNGKGGDRYIVGVLKRYASNEIMFRYILKECAKAKLEGFKDYPGFPLSDKIYRDNVLDIFALRLMPIERTDREKYLSFWEAENITDTFDLLALTQGLTHTDNFEFLGVYHYSKDFSFITDIAGLSYRVINPEKISIGDILKYVYESENKSDQYAVKIYKGDLFLGYVKKVHTRFFRGAKNKELNISIKHIEKNGEVKNIYIRVSAQ